MKSCAVCGKPGKKLVKKVNLWFCDDCFDNISQSPREAKTKRARRYNNAGGLRAFTCPLCGTFFLRPTAMEDYLIEPPHNWSDYFNYLNVYAYHCQECDLHYLLSFLSRTLDIDDTIVFSYVNMDAEDVSGFLKKIVKAIGDDIKKSLYHNIQWGKKE